MLAVSRVRTGYGQTNQKEAHAPPGRDCEIRTLVTVHGRRARGRPQGIRTLPTVIRSLVTRSGVVPRTLVTLPNRIPISLLGASAEYEPELWMKVAG